MGIGKVFGFALWRGVIVQLEFTAAMGDEAMGFGADGLGAAFVRESGMALGIWIF